MIGFLHDHGHEHPACRSGSRLCRLLLVAGLFLLVASDGGSGGSGPDTLARQIEELHRQLRRDPRSGRIHLHLSGAYRERGNLLAARAHAEEGLRLGLGGDDSTRAIQILADVALRQGRHHEGYRLLRDLVAAGKAPPDAMARLAQIRWEDRFWPEALMLGMEAAGKDPEDPEKSRWLARRWKEAGRPDLALTLWRRLDRIGAATEEDLFQIGYLSQRLDGRQGAVDAYRKLLDRNPIHPEGNYNYSLLLLSGGDTVGAACHLERVIEVAPEMQPAYLDLALLYLRTGERAEARRVLQRFLSSGDPDSVSDADVREILRSLSGSADR